MLGAVLKMYFDFVLQQKFEFEGNRDQLVLLLN
jgi:hypothetical protein